MAKHPSLHSRPASPHSAQAAAPGAALAASMLALLLAACGGGGGGGSTTVPAPPAPPPEPPPPPPPPAFALALREVASGLDAPLFLTAPSGDTRRFIVERAGRIRILGADGSLAATPFLDLSGLISTTGEGGLLSLAFHPGYAQNGRFYIYYTDKFDNIAIDEARVSANPALADRDSLKRIITIPHPQYSNHYGGLLAFGPDGYLYAGTGDGGGAGDPNGNAQNLDSLLGKLLRLNVDNPLPPLYTVPADNPFVGQEGKRGEIWAYGLRNPWRFAFDPAAGALYIADVGQDQREEVNIVSSAQKAANFGWNIMEGTRCYNAASCAQQGLTLPAFEYEHGAGDANGCSITGGFVYRGAALPELAGRYLYSDYCKGFLKSFLYANGALSEVREWPVASIGAVPAFGQDGAGELYMLSGAGKVYQIVRQ